MAQHDRSSHAAIRLVDPVLEFEGPVMVLAPHSDDEVLACGGTIALLVEKTDVHVVYATDGRMSPRGPDGRPVADASQLVEQRKREAIDATASLGLPRRNLHFLDFPDGALQRTLPRFEAALAALLHEIQPATLFAPFRHDQHPDHLATHRGAVGALRRLPQIRLVQYFIYYQFPFGTIADIRAAMDPQHLVRVDIDAARADKQRALQLYPSQVATHYPWQTQPSLSAGFLDGHCRGDEIFAIPPAGTPDRALFHPRTPGFWIALYAAPRAVQYKKRLFG